MAESSLQQVSGAVAVVFASRDAAVDVQIIHGTVWE